MNDFHWIFFHDNQNLGMDTTICFLSGTVPKLSDISYFCDQGNFEKCSIVIIRHPAVSTNWGPMQLISVIKALGTCHFHVHCVVYKLANSTFWCYLAALLDLCLLEIVIHDWLSFKRLPWQSTPRYRHQNRFSERYGSKTIGYLTVLQLC